MSDTVIRRSLEQYETHAEKARTLILQAEMLWENSSNADANVRIMLEFARVHATLAQAAAAQFAGEMAGEIATDAVKR